MSDDQHPKAADHNTPTWRNATAWDYLILVLSLALIAAFHSEAMHDRLLLIIYTMVISGSAFVLLRRGALVFTVMTVAAAGTALLVDVYFDAKTDAWHPLADPIRDVVGISLLAFGMAKLIRDMSIHRFSHYFSFFFIILYWPEIFRNRSRTCSGLNPARLGSM